MAGFTRRQLLGHALVGTGALSWLAACGSDDEAGTTTAVTTAAPGPPAPSGTSASTAAGSSATGSAAASSVAAGDLVIYPAQAKDLAVI